MPTIHTKQITHGNPHCVILLHGLCRTHRSMSSIMRNLSAHGYDLYNMGYPSRKHTIAQLARKIFKHISSMDMASYAKIHFVTHSMGGIIVRQMLARQSFKNLGRVVMISPPNQGSEVVDTLKHWPLFRMLNGPAGVQLGTDPSAVPQYLGPVDFDLGVIVGRRSVNWILSTMIPGENDGKVSVKRARIQGMRDFLVVNATHPFIMKNKKVLRQTLFYLRNGKFSHSSTT